MSLNIHARAIHARIASGLSSRTLLLAPLLLALGLAGQAAPANASSPLMSPARSAAPSQAAPAVAPSLFLAQFNTSHGLGLGGGNQGGNQGGNNPGGAGGSSTGSGNNGGGGGNNGGGDSNICSGADGRNCSPNHRKRKNFNCPTTHYVPGCFPPPRHEPKPRPRKTVRFTEDGRCCHRHAVKVRVKVRGKWRIRWRYGKWHCHRKAKRYRHCVAAQHRRLNHSWMR